MENNFAILGSQEKEPVSKKILQKSKTTQKRQANKTKKIPRS
jgi:hypothetical protein